jgi:hypothetical protein
MQNKSLEMRHRWRADSGKFLEWLPRPSQASSSGHHTFGRSSNDLLHWEFPEANFWPNNFRLALQLGAS